MNDHDLAIYKPFRCEGGTNQEGASETIPRELVPSPHVEAEEPHVEGEEPHVEGEEPGAMPTSRTTVLVRKERTKQDGLDLEVSLLGKQSITSDSDSETDSLGASILPKPMLPRNFSNSTCTTASPQSLHILSEYSASSDSSDGVGDGNGHYLLPVQEKKRGAVHENPKGGKLQACRTVLPPEYQFNIRPHMFTCQWSKTKRFKGGGLKVKTTTSLSSDNNAIVTIAVKNAKSDCQYRAFANVTLYDPNAGNILGDKEEEERSFTGDHGHAVKFTVSFGALTNISRRKKLSLQVKVKVYEDRLMPIVRVHHTA